MGKRAFKYILISMSLFFAISLIEIFLLRPLIDFIGNDFKTHLIVYSILMMIVNPLVAKIIADKIDDKLIQREDGQ